MAKPSIWIALILSTLVLLCLFPLLTVKTSPLSPYFEDNGRLKVLSTTAMIDDLVGEIGGERVDHVALIVGNLDPHSYELVKEDGEKLERAHLIFYNGLGLEHGASLHHYLKRKGAVALGDDLLSKRREDFIWLGDQVDPHFWMDVGLFSEVVPLIVERLCEQLPEHAAQFRKEGERVRSALLEADQSFLQKMQSIVPDRRYLVTGHDAFNYFARKYLKDPSEIEWQRRTIAPEGLAPDGQMGVMDIWKVVNFVLNYRLSVIFPEANVNCDALEKVISICHERGAHVRLAPVPLYGDTMGEGEARAQTYLQMVEHNVSVLYKYLSESS